MVPSPEEQKNESNLTANDASSTPEQSLAISTENSTPTSMADSKPRVWTVVVTSIVALLAYLFVSVVSTIVGFMIAGVDFRKPPSDYSNIVNKFADHPSALLISIIPSHAAIILTVVMAALISSSPFTERLAIKFCSWPQWVTICAVLATPIFPLLFGPIISNFIPSNEYQEMISRMVKSSSTWLGPVLTGMCIAVVPAFSEEWFFRGYIQTRLIQRMRPWLAILLTSVLFAAFHFSPIHAIMVLPIGLWLGFIAYRSGSIIPAMLGHGYNNSLSAFSALNEQISPVLEWSIVGVGVIGLLGTLYYLATTRKPTGNPVLD